MGDFYISDFYTIILRCTAICKDFIVIYEGKWAAALLLKPRDALDKSIGLFLTKYSNKARLTVVCKGLNNSCMNHFQIKKIEVHLK